jgi:pyruvate kinase
MRAKIVCTIGPACADAKILERMIEAGMRVARLNFSHGTHAEHAERAALVRAASKRTKTPVALLQDVQGPKVRLGHFVGGETFVKPGAHVTLTTRKVQGNASLLPTPVRALARDLNAGHQVLLDDGKVKLRVIRIDGQDIRCVVETGGRLADHKGINVPSVALSVPTLTNKDVADIAFGQRLGVDFVALSFVRSARDVESCRRLVAKLKTPLIAKIEKPQAIADLPAIVSAADGIMVARGDLGVEVPLSTVPFLQKSMITAANAQGGLVIVATEMLESMIEKPRATRAEISDIANAVLDGADALMLSGETAVGRFPVEAVQTMADVISEAEKQRPRLLVEPFSRTDSIGIGVAAAAASAADRLEAALIATYTESGATARFVSEMRPKAPILALTPNVRTINRTALYWGVTAQRVPQATSLEAMVNRVLERCKAQQLARPGQAIVIVAGTPLNQPGQTNTLIIRKAR